MEISHQRCWAEIDLAALRHNVTTLNGRLGGQAGIMAIVKANAYGHGAVPLVTELAPLVRAFGVANVNEAVQLADIVEPSRIYLLGTALPDERKEIAGRGFVPVISSAAEAREFEWVAGRHPVSVTVAIDTGMGRIGIDEKAAAAEVAKIAALPHIQIKSIATHLPVADEDELFTKEQLERFTAVVKTLRAAGHAAPAVHALNSAGAIRFPWGAFDMARIGLALYGTSPVPAFQELQPVMTLKTRITLVREHPAGHSISYGRTFITPRAMRVATLAVGYADGYQRRLSGQGAGVLVRGRRCPVLGRVTMDQIMVDVTGVPDAVPGDEVVVLGRQGKSEITAASLAEMAGTIPWEIFTGISARVARTYIHPVRRARKNAPA